MSPQSQPTRALPFATPAAIAASVLVALLYVALPPDGASLPGFFEFLGRFHTLALHLPVGVLLLIGFVEGLTLLRPQWKERTAPALDVALPFLLATAVAAFALGVLLARGGGYPGKTVTLHRTLTMLAVFGMGACLVTWSRRLSPEGAENRTPYRATLGLTLALLTAGAHFGGSLTHGDNYLSRYAPGFVQKLLGTPPIATAEAVTADPGAEPLVYAAAIAPLLKRECVECHGPEKVKGGLRLDSLAAILKGGETGPALVVGQGAKSELVKRMLLPSGDDDHMPPAAKPQPTSGEIDLLRWWIDRGANDTLRVRDALAPDGARTILGSTLAPLPTGTAVAASTVPTPAPPSSATAAPAGSIAAPAPPANGALAYRDVVAPLLASACGDCHGAAKQKGNLRVDSLAALLQGGKNGAAIVPGNASAGTLLTRVHLPLADDRHMPPQDHPQLSPGQVAVLSRWVAQGASDTMPASELPRVSSRVARATTTTEGPGPRSGGSQGTTHGATPATPSLAELKVGPGQVALYRDVVAPVLARRCGECHSGSHDEGGMRVDDLAALVHDKELVPGKPDGSPIVKRMSLPASSGDRMPPPEKDPAAAWETAAVAMWVARGATPDLVVASADLPPAVAQGLASSSSPASTTPSAASATPPGAPGPGETPPPGTVVPPRAAGCGACAVGAPSQRAPWGALVGVASLAALGVARRRGLYTRRVRRALVASCFAALLVACSGASSVLTDHDSGTGGGPLDSGIGAQDTGASGQDTGSAMDAPSNTCNPTPPDGGACNSLAVSGTPVPLQCNSAMMPTPQGGTIVDGTYVMTSAVFYGAQCPPPEQNRNTWLVCGNHWQTTQENTPGTGTPKTYSYDLVESQASPTQLSLQVTCPASSTVKFSYDATPTTLTLYVGGGTNPGEGRVDIYTRQ